MIFGLVGLSKSTWHSDDFSFLEGIWKVRWDRQDPWSSRLRLLLDESRLRLFSAAGGKARGYYLLRGNGPSMAQKILHFVGDCATAVPTRKRSTTCAICLNLQIPSEKMAQPKCRSPFSFNLDLRHSVIIRHWARHQKMASFPFQRPLQVNHLRPHFFHAGIEPQRAAKGFQRRNRIVLQLIRLTHDRRGQEVIGVDL